MILLSLLIVASAFFSKLFLFFFFSSVSSTKLKSTQGKANFHNLYKWAQMGIVRA